MPPPLILSLLPPPLNAQPRPIKAPSPLVCWHLLSRLSLVRRLVVASPVVVCLRLASPSSHSCRTRPSLTPPLCLCQLVVARISSQRLRLSMRHRLTTGCVVAVANAQGVAPSPSSSTLPYVPPPRITFRCAAAVRVHPRPLLFVRASWLSRRISLHGLRLSTHRRLTTGCVVAITDAQASLPSSRLRLSPLSHIVKWHHRTRCH